MMYVLSGHLLLTTESLALAVFFPWEIATTVAAHLDPESYLIRTADLTGREAKLFTDPALSYYPP